MEAAAAESLSSWAEFGLVGLVIFALFGVLVFLFKSHSEERREWRTEIKDQHSSTLKSSEKLHTAIGSLTESIKDLRRDVTG